MELEAYTIVDGVVLLILIISAVLAFSRGLVREVMSIVGWLIAAVVAFIFAPQLYPVVSEIPYLKDILNGNCVYGVLAAFAIIFAGVLIIVSIFTPLFSGLVANSALGPMDRGLGFLFGIARGVVLVAVALTVYLIITDGGAGIEQVETSKSKELLADFATSIRANVLGAETEAGVVSDSQALIWVQNKFEELMTTCSNG
jgi:membrane protein required for colicin V production